MNSDNSLYDLFSPGFWEENLNTPFDDFYEWFLNVCNEVFSDLEMFLKLWILLVCPSLTQKIWQSKEKL